MKGCNKNRKVINDLFLHPPTIQKVLGGGASTGIRLSVGISVHVSVCGSICVQNTSFCQTAGGSIKSLLMTALVSSLSEDNLRYCGSHVIVRCVNIYIFTYHSTFYPMTKFYTGLS